MPWFLTTQSRPSVFWPERLHRARRGLEEDIVDRIGRFLDVHEVVKPRLVLLKRLLHSAYCLRPLPSIRPARTDGLC